ncbi:hypothetical protein N9H57_05865 [Flavobacteriaceae bacterium]|nr:hypothetical protein [Flavobacteriaceae bacterium]
MFTQIYSLPYAPLGNPLVNRKTYTAAYAYEFGIPSGQVAVTRSGNEIFLKFKF